MKIAIMQPYFLPYLGYFGLIKHTDQFILLDSVQYIRHGWIDRNRILKPESDWQYIKVPVRKHSRETLISDIFINNEQDWKFRILGQIQHYKKRAPFFNEVFDLLKSIFTQEYQSIVQLDFMSLKAICEYLGIHTDLKVFSNMKLTIEPPNAPDEWALNICKALSGVSEYWNPPGGRDFFDKKKYQDNSIDLKFLKVNLRPYNQRRGEFEEGLSIIDVLMFNGVDEINRMLDDYSLA